MKTMAIVGGGPIGLYLAIRLSQIIQAQSLPLRVVVIEPQLGEYNRPGIVAKNVLELIEKHIKLGNEVLKASDDSDSSIFIGRLELALYKQAGYFNIQFVKASLIGIDKQGCLILDNGKLMSCDYAFDCTGARRKPLHSVNDSVAQDVAFSFSKVADNPMKHHFVAYVTMDAVNARLMLEDTTRAPLWRALGVQQLRTEFGWPEFVEPELSQRKYTSRDGVLFYLYFETPPHFNQVSKEKQKQWLSTLIQLKTGYALKYTVEEDPLKFSAFVVDPDKVNEPYFLSKQLPFMTLPMGDAHIKPDFRLGIGIRSGVLRTDTFIKAFAENQGNMPAALRQYESLLQHPLGWHETTLQSEYRQAREKLTNTLPEVKKMVLSALSEAKADRDRMLLQTGLDDINTCLAQQHFTKAKDHFNQAAEEKNAQQSVRKIRVSKLNLVLEQESLRECEKELFTAMELMPEWKQKVIQDELLDLAMSYKDVAGRLFQNHQKADAKRYYKAAARLFSRFFEKEQSLELVKIYSNLLLIAKQQQQEYERLKKYADRGLKYLEYHDMTSPEMKKLYAKINFNHCEGIFTLVENELKKETVDEKVISKQLKKAEDIYGLLINQDLLSEAEDKKILALLGRIKESMIQMNQTIGKTT